MSSHIPSLPERSDVVVVGAGLAGLAVAVDVQAAGRSVTLLEASDGVGGRVRTDIVDGYRLDRGFQVLLTDYPEFAARFDERDLDLRRFEPGAVVFTEGRFHTVGDPLRRPSTLLPTLRAPVGSVSDKLRLIGLRARLRRADSRQLLRQPDTSTGTALADRGFSPTMVERFFRPLVGGIQLDPSLHTSVRMFDVILRGLLRGDAAVPGSGMGALSDNLAARLQQGTVHLSTPVTAVESGRVHLAGGRTLEVERVVVATDGPSASGLLGLDPVASNPATCVWFAAPGSPQPGRYIVLVGNGGGPAANVAVMSDVAPSYSPDGSALIAAACPGLLDPDAEPAVRAQMKAMWGDQVDEWRHLRTDAIAHGQPQQHPPFEHKRPVGLGDGMFVCGDHRDTSSIQGALFSGRRTARAVVDSLT